MSAPEVDAAVGTEVDAGVDAEICRDLLARWDVQQMVYVRERERAYELMLAVLDDHVGPAARVLDLAAGPGSISARLLASRPSASSTAVDVDPVLQTIGRGALGDQGGRLRWVAADLRDPDWVTGLGGAAFDAVVSSTALHWLSPTELAALYGSLATILPSGGVFMNFDGFRLDRPTGPIAGTVKRLDRRRQEQAVAEGADAWEDWWDAARAVPDLEAAFARRDEIFAPARGRVFSGADRDRGTTVAFHLAALDAAGFAEAGCVWQDLHKSIVLAVR